MSILAKRQHIRCSGCSYLGPSRIEGTRSKPLIMTGLLTGLAFCSWPIAFLAGPYALWAVCKPAQHVCPQCWRPGIPES
jgi:hypothetical protein